MNATTALSVAVLTLLTDAGFDPQVSEPYPDQTGPTYGRADAQDGGGIVLTYPTAAGWLVEYVGADDPQPAPLTACPVPLRELLNGLRLLGWID